MAQPLVFAPASGAAGAGGPPLVTHNLDLGLGFQVNGVLGRRAFEAPAGAHVALYGFSFNVEGGLDTVSGPGICLLCDRIISMGGYCPGAAMASCLGSP